MLVTARHNVTRMGKGRTGLSTAEAGVITPTSWNNISGCGKWFWSLSPQSARPRNWSWLSKGCSASSVLFPTHLYLLQKHCLRYLCIFSMFYIRYNTLYCNCMFLAKSEDGPIQAGHNEDKGEVDNVWEKTGWSPEWALELNPMKLHWSKGVWQVEPERKEADNSQKGLLDCQVT